MKEIWLIYVHSNFKTWHIKHQSMNLYQILKDMLETAIYFLLHSILCHYSLLIQKFKKKSVHL